MSVRVEVRVYDSVECTEAVHLSRRVPDIDWNLEISYSLIQKVVDAIEGFFKDHADERLDKNR